MRLRTSEIDQDAVTHIARDKPAEALNRLGDAAVIRTHDPAQILGIEPSGQQRRADEIAEHHCELAAFRGIGARWGRLAWRSRSSGFRNGLATAAAEFRAWLVLETACWARRGQRRPALGAKAP